MYDGPPSITIPVRDPLMICGGPAWRQADFDKWPGAAHVRLDHDASHPEWNVLDFERTYEFDPAMAVTWVRRRLQLGPYRVTRPTIYSWHGNYELLALALEGARLAWDWWAADHTGAEHVFRSPYGWKIPVATQWAIGEPGISLVTDGTWCPSMRMAA